MPVVAVVHHGNHLYAPFWDYKHKRKVPMHTVFTQIITAEEAATLSVAEINRRIREALQYDDYRYQKENGIRITEPFRAQGLHRVLYKCPHCGEEFQMGSEGAELFCKACGKRWLWQEDGYLKATEGETEFDHIPDWFDWERKTVSDEIDRGEYFYQAEVEVRSLPRTFRYIPLGKATLTHDPKEGFTLDGHYRGERWHINRQCAQTNSLHVEYEFAPLQDKDLIDISTENDSFYCFIPEPGRITKLAFATEELYLRSQKKA